MVLNVLKTATYYMECEQIDKDSDNLKVQSYVSEQLEVLTEELEKL